MALNIIVGLFLVPYLIRRLGVEAYGIIPLANYFIQYLSLVSLALNSAVGRYIAIALEKGMKEESNRIFNTAFWSNLVVVSLLLLISIPIIIFLDKIINLPTSIEQASRFLFICTFLGFYLSIATSAFAVSSWCLNRFDLLNGISIIRQTVYLSLIMILFSFFQGNLFSVGIAILGGALTTTTLNYVLSRQLLPHLRIGIRYFERASLRKLLSTGGWISINKIGSILYLQIDLFVLNRLLGTFIAGQYASILQMSMVVRMLGAAISSVFGPPMVYLVAQNNRSELVRYTRRSLLFLGMSMALPIGLICGFSKPLLSLWLGNDFSTLSTLLIVLTAHLSVNVTVYPFFELQTATNRVRWPGLITCIMGAANFALALSLAGWTSLGMYGVAAAGAIMLTLKNALFTPIYGALIIGQCWYLFLKELILITFLTCAVFLVSTSLLTFIKIDTWIELILSSAFISATYCLVVWTFLPKEEKRLIVEKVGEIFGRMGIAYAGK